MIAANRSFSEKFRRTIFLSEIKLLGAGKIWSIKYCAAVFLDLNVVAEVDKRYETIYKNSVLKICLTC